MFVAVLALWTAGKFGADSSPTERRFEAQEATGAVARSAAPPDSNGPTPPDPASPTLQNEAVLSVAVITAATETVAPSPIVAYHAPVTAPTARPTAPPQPTPAPRLSAAEEQARYAALESEAKRATGAMLAGDVGSVVAMLSDRCAGVDVATLIATRQTVAQRETGKALGAIKAAQPLIAHFDTQFGEAHLLIQVDVPERVTLTAYEGWLWEAGRWRLAPCLLPP